GHDEHDVGPVRTPGSSRAAALDPEQEPHRHGRQHEVFTDLTAVTPASGSGTLSSHGSVSAPALATRLIRGYATNIRRFTCSRQGDLIERAGSLGEIQHRIRL